MRAERAADKLQAKRDGSKGWKAHCPIHQHDYFLDPNLAPPGDKPDMMILRDGDDGYPTYECQSRECHRDSFREFMEQLRAKLGDDLVRSLGRNNQSGTEPEHDLPSRDELQEWHDLLLNNDPRKRDVSKPYLDYLINDIGLSRELIKELHIGRQRDWYAQGRFRDVITLPVFNADGELRNVVRWDPVKGAWGGQKHSWAGVKSSRNLLGADRGASYPDGDRIVLAAGVTDYLAGIVHGLPVVATIAGEAAELAGDVEVLAGREVAVCFDNDDAGKRGGPKVARSVHDVGGQPFVVDISALAPKRGGDLRDALGDHGADAVRELVAGARPWAYVSQEVEAEVEKIRNRQLARDLLDSEAWQPPADSGSLKELLSEPWEPPEYIIDGWAYHGTNINIIATYKIGKSVLAMNVARALCDGEDFLGQFATYLRTGNVAYWNGELSRSMALHWLERIQVDNPDRLVLLNLRGHSMTLTDPMIKAWTVNWLRDNGVRVWIIDPESAIYDRDENDNAEKGRWLKAIDDIKRLAEVETVFIVTHTGHSNGDEQEVRTRGASKSMGWFDTFWRYSRNADSDTRWLSSEGRDEVDNLDLALSFDSVTQVLSINTNARGKREDALYNRALKAFDKLAEIKRANPEEIISPTELKERMSRNKKDMDAINYAVELGWLKFEPGRNRGKQVVLGAVNPREKLKVGLLGPTKAD